MWETFRQACRNDPFARTLASCKCARRVVAVRTNDGPAQKEMKDTNDMNDTDDMKNMSDMNVYIYIYIFLNFFIVYI